MTDKLMMFEEAMDALEGSISSARMEYQNVRYIDGESKVRTARAREIALAEARVWRAAFRHIEGVLRNPDGKPYMIEYAENMEALAAEKRAGGGE